MPTAGFETAIPTSDRQRKDALDGAATRIGLLENYFYVFVTTSKP